VKKIIILFSLVCGTNALACESPLENQGIAKLNLKQATGALSRALLSLERSKPNPTQNVADIDCYLEKQTEFFTRLDEIRLPLKTLGDALLTAQDLTDKRAVTNKLKRLIARDASTGFVQFPNSKESAVSFNLFNELVNTYCSDEGSRACGYATDLAKKLWWIAGEYRSFADTVNQDDKVASLEFIEKLDRQWRSYKNDTIKLWPQEVLLNSLTYKPNSQGLSPPPAYKLLALRPALGLSYLSDQNHRIQPTINVNLLGIYWWQYDDTSASAGRGLSASLIWDGDDTAYGLTYHHNPKWSATLANGDKNDIVVSISFQLAHWLLRS